MGIYDLNHNRVLFKPQFTDVTFEDDGWISVETHDAQSGQDVEKLIDRAGIEKLHSISTSIVGCGEMHHADERGRDMLRYVNDAKCVGIDYEHNRIVCRENGKCGVKDFDGNILVEPAYDHTQGTDKPLLTALVGERYSLHTEGLITHTGQEVVPPVFRRITWLKDGHIICSGNGHCEMLVCIER